jgi:probable HAF family extracellular repeat protein
MLDLGTLGGTFSAPAAVNDGGQTVGYSYTAGNAEFHAFSWTKKGGMLDLGALPGGLSAAGAVNGEGLIVGYSFTAGYYQHAVLWRLSEENH